MSIGVNTTYPKKVNQATTNSAGGVNLGPVVSISNLSSGGSIGSASTTVDVASVFNINQSVSTKRITNLCIEKTNTFNIGRFNFHILLGF